MSCTDPDHYNQWLHIPLGTYCIDPEVWPLHILRLPTSMIRRHKTNQMVAMLYVGRWLLCIR